MFRFLFALLLLSGTAVAQPDSLFRQDEQQVYRLNEWYIHNVRSFSPDTALPALAILREAAARRSDRLVSCAATYYEGQYHANKLKDTILGIALMNRAISEAHAGGRKLQEAIYLHHLGYYYSFTNNYSNALVYLLHANELFDELGPEKDPAVVSNYYRVAFIYYHLEDYEEALLYCRKGLAYNERRNMYTMYVANTTGQCFSKLMRADSALKYFQQTLHLAREGRHIAWEGIALGNIGNLYLDRHHYAEARPYFEKYLQNSLQTGQWSCRAEALTALARIDLESGNLGAALTGLHQAQGIFDSIRQRQPLTIENYPRLRSLYSNLALLYERRGNPGEAYRYLKLENAIHDSLDRRALLAGASTARQQVQAEKMRGQQQLMESDRETERLRRIFLVAALAMVLIIALLFINRIRLKMRRSRALHQEREQKLLADNTQMRADLMSAQESLHTFRENLRQKTFAFQELEQQLAALRIQESAITQEQVDALTELTRATILTPQDWTAFRNDFEKVYPDFFKRLRERYPTLSPAETRLLALTKLGLSTPEMAAMLGVSPDSVKKTRQRLRKELELPQASSLQQLVDDL
ncbi:MAG: tetratricopeptide repeat protein [Chitinophagaceae bacterium]|nr:MAG: tetratricopeptide repeat protein [Chitinophagaceae bacterium]